MRKCTFRSIVFVGLAAVIMSCSAVERQEAVTVATQAALGTPPPPKYQTLAAIYYPTGTPSPARDTLPDMAATLVYQNMVANMTEQAAEQEAAAMSAQQTATGIAVAATVNYGNQRATAEMQYQREQATAQAISAERTATYQAESVAATSTQSERWVQGTATERAWLATQSAVETQAAWNATATQSSFVALATRDTAAYAAQATAQAAEVESVQLKLKRERMTNNLIAWGPWALALVLVTAGLFFADRLSRIGRIEHDSSGQMPGVAMLSNGAWRFLMPDRMFGPAVEVGRNGMSAPQLANSDQQENATRRAQAVEALRQLPPGHPNQANSIAQSGFGGTRTIARGIEIIQERGALGPVVDDLESKLLGDA